MDRCNYHVYDYEPPGELRGPQAVLKLECVSRAARVLSSPFEGGTMLFKKLFRLLVLGGAMVGTASGCAGASQTLAGAEKTPEGRDGGASPDGGTAKAQDAGGGTADAGGGVTGW